MFPKENDEETEMAMNKKEKELIEKLLTEASLRRTSEVIPDVPPPEGLQVLSTGYLPIGASGSSARVEEACSSCVHHGTGRTDRTTTQGSRYLYSTRLLALKRLRFEVENDCMMRLRRIDMMIEKEMENE